MTPRRSGARGFTLVELLAVIAVISVLAALLLPALNQASGRAQAIMCLSNTKQLSLAWHVYAGDNNDRVAYNMDLASTGRRTDLNWVNNVMSWTTSSENTNVETITKSGLGVYVGNPATYRCPTDNVLSPAQKAAGWDARLRSYSMNMMVGELETPTNKVNPYNPAFKQFYKAAQIPQPSEIFVFLEEHPDSIDDGYFKMAAPQNVSFAANSVDAQWIDLPAANHNRAAAFAYADGHSQLHRWQVKETVRPSHPDAAKPRPKLVPLTDYNWVLSHMSVYSTHVLQQEN